MLAPTVPTEEDWKVVKRGEKQYDRAARKLPGPVPRSTGWNQNPRTPVSFASACSAWGSAVKTTWLSLRRNGDGLRQLKRHLTMNGEDGNVLVCLSLLGIFGIGLGLVFRSGYGIGFQIVRLSVDDH